ncbi:MAG: efflux RND transporter periplasmic adaptor subunit [Candidatus Cyclobacteriaceae bacterium M2_1C_046]
MEKRQIIIVASGLALLAISYFGMVYLGNQKEEPEKKIPAELKRYVKTDQVIYKDVPTEILTFGRVSTAEHLDLIAQVSGTMAQGNIPLKEGQRFKKGALLFKVDDAEAKLNLQAQKSKFLKDLASILPDLKIDYNDNYPNWEKYFEAIDTEKKLPALPEVKSSKEKTFLATRDIFSSFYSIKSSEEQLKKYRFYAPFDGTFYLVNLQNGSHVNPGSNIARIIESGNIEVKVDVDVKDVEWITVGSPAYLSTESGAGNWIGRVTRVSDFVNQNTQSIDVYIEVQKNKTPIYSGQYLQAAIPGKQVPGSMLIPREALFNGNEVFLLQDTLLKVSEVRIHKINPETVVINGVPEGSDIVVEALVNAYNNMKAYKLDATRKIDVEEKSTNTELVNN